MTTILVTGAAGFIGSHTVDHLLAAGRRVVGVDNFRTGKWENLATARQNRRFLFSKMDVTNLAALDRLAAKIRPAAIIHLAALVSVPESFAQPELNYELNVAATQAVAEVAQRRGVRRIVFASSAAVYGDARPPLAEDAAVNPLSPYGAAKLASEAILLGYACAFDLTVRGQRYFNVYGPRQDPASPYSGVISVFLKNLRAGKAIVINGDGRQTRDFIAVRDVARANVIAATGANIASGVANICAGRATSINQLADALRKNFPGAPKPRHAPTRIGDARHSLGATAKARKDLGFRAEVSLAEGLKELVNAS